MRVKPVGSASTLPASIMASIWPRVTPSRAAASPIVKTPMERLTEAAGGGLLTVGLAEALGFGGSMIESGW
jgi:hypothetical protein